MLGEVAVSFMVAPIFFFKFSDLLVNIFSVTIFVTSSKFL